MTLRRILSAVFVPLFIFMAVAFPMEKSYAAGSLNLLYNHQMLINIGSQGQWADKTGNDDYNQSCSAFCLTYAHALITNGNEINDPSYYWGGSPWPKAGYTADYYASDDYNKLFVLQKAYDELNDRRLPILFVTLGGYTNEGPYRHYVLVVGYQNVTSRDSLTEGNFLVIDPNKPSMVKTLGKTGYGGQVTLGYEGRVGIAYSKATNERVHWFGDWGKNDTNHWRECIDPGCPDRVRWDDRPHVYDNDADTTCNTCGYVRNIHTHTFGKWSVIKEASSTNPGSKKRSCSTCGYEYTAEIPVITYTHTNAKVKMKYDVHIKKTPYASGERVHKCSVGDTFYIGAYLNNKYGNIWYQILSGPYAGYYIFSGETEFVEYVDDLSITGNTFPSNIAQGVDYKPSEVIKSRHRITSVFGAIGLKDGGKTKDVYNASVKPEVHDSYSIVGSPISDALKFDQLTPGNYNYAILASAIADFYTQEKGADIGEGITRLRSETFWKDYQREFTVYHEHNYGGWVHDSVNHWHECTCGDKTDVAEHSFGEWTVTKEASTTEPGSKTRSCSVCGFEETLEIPVLSHTHSYGTDWKNNETSHWHECTCGDKTDMTEHSFGEWTVTKEASTTEPGSKTRSCSVCGFEETLEIPVLSHTHSYGTDWKNNETSHWHECTCGDKTDMTEHSFGEWTVTKEASTTEPGSKTRSCSVCGFEETLEIPVLSHTHSYGTDWKNNETSHWHECTCGDKADMAAHSFRWIIDRAATATQKGSKHEECTVCGYRRAAVEIPATGTTTGGTTGGGSHWHPSVTTTPVPVIVIPPKTGDMTIWQSILHFLGIR